MTEYGSNNPETLNIILKNLKIIYTELLIITRLQIIAQIFYSTLTSEVSEDQRTRSAPSKTLDL